MTKSTILVTGATGFTGYHAVRQLRKNYHVVGTSRYGNKETIRVDLTNQIAVHEMVAKVKPDLILHLAGQNNVKLSWKDPAVTIESNVLATLYLLEAARVHVPKCRIVVVGSALQTESAYPHPYSFSKSLQAKLALTWGDLYGMSTLLAIPCNLIGPGPSTGICTLIANQLVRANKSTDIQLSNALAKRDYLDVRDAARAYELLLAKGDVGKIYEIGSGRERTLEEVVDEFQKMTLTRLNVSYEERKPEVKDRSSLTAISQLGWQPVISFETSLRDIMRYAEENEMKRGKV